MSRSVLIIDDHVSLAHAFARVLEGAGYEAYSAYNAEDGLRLAELRQPSVIVLDLKMPLINGVGFLYRLRACPALGETPVLVVTGGGVNDEMRRELAELDAVIRLKPIGVHALITEVDTLVNDAPVPPLCRANTTVCEVTATSRPTAGGTNNANPFKRDTI